MNGRRSLVAIGRCASGRGTRPRKVTRLERPFVVPNRTTVGETRRKVQRVGYAADTPRLPDVENGRPVSTSWCRPRGLQISSETPTTPEPPSAKSMHGNRRQVALKSNSADIETDRGTLAAGDWWGVLRNGSFRVVAGTRCGPERGRQSRAAFQRSMNVENSVIDPCTGTDGMRSSSISATARPPITRVRSSSTHRFANSTSREFTSGASA